MRYGSIAILLALAVVASAQSTSADDGPFEPVRKYAFYLVDSVDEKIQNPCSDPIVRQTLCCQPIQDPEGDGISQDVNPRGSVWVSVGATYTDPQNEDKVYGKKIAVGC